MFFSRFRRDRQAADTISALYGMIVAQARLPVFYRAFGVPDTINGRFDLLVLHLSLVTARLMPDEALKPVGQGLFDRFCEDMDHNLREIGISDLKVPKEMRRMGEAFYGRAQAYEAALASPDPAALVATVVRNVYEGVEAPAASGLTAYMRQAAARLQARPAADLVAGTVDWPDPADHLTSLQKA